ncbi:MAG: hypothetical protein ACTHNU_12380, partial [Gaiellales bacterium]
MATITARLGRPPGTIPISLGQRVLAVSGGAQPKIVADISRGHGASFDGLAAIPHARFAVGHAGVVISDGAPPADSRLALAAVDGAYPGLARRYGATALPAPIVVIVPSRKAAEGVVGYPISQWEAGSEYGGLVILVRPEWCCGPFSQGIVVHELTHAATRLMVVGDPISLVEGVARYEEQRWDAAHGAPYPTSDLSAAYLRGWNA